MKEMVADKTLAHSLSSPNHQHSIYWVDAAKAAGLYMVIMGHI